VRRNKFSLSNYKLLTCNMGQLVPCGLREVLPGDTFQHSTSALIRTTPLNAPVMHPTHAKIHHWFVPNRLIWEDWEKFITGGEDGMDASVYPTMEITNPGYSVGSLADYLGVPTQRPSVSGSFKHSALPFRAYALIWNEWYRDQDLQTKLVISKASGTDTTTSRVLQNVAWEKDYFTTARPWTQKGPEITVPLGIEAPVLGISKRDETFPLSDTLGYDSSGVDSAQVTYENAQSIKGATVADEFYVEQRPEGDPRPYIRADLSEATGATINELRLAFALQRYEENRARHGSRYTEYLALLGVRSSDARLQRPEYLGGGKQTLQYSEVLQTSPTELDEDLQPVGSLAGHGIGALRSNRYRRYFEEHGWVISFIVVKPTTMYMNNLERHWNRRTKEDFFQKELQHIGQQEVLKKEVYVPSETVSDTISSEMWGYQDRYDEYRRAESTVAGEFRTTLDFWHMARKFAGTSSISTPELNAAFIKSDPTDRVFAIPSSTSHTLQMMVNHSIQARRIVASSGRSFIL